jgi:hypothetical protein
MARVSIKGVLFGGITDVGLSMILGMPIGIYAGLKVSIAHTPTAQVHSAVLAILHRPEVYLTELIIGFACSVLGGYVAATLARHDEILNGCLSSILCVLEGIWTIWTGQISDPIWQQLLLLIASPALGNL